MSQSEFPDYVVHDFLGELHGSTSRRMFGGFGIYQNGIIFAVISNDVLYFKVNDTNRHDYEALESKPFTYQRKNHPRTVMSYYEIPEEIMENKEKLAQWVEKSVTASKSSKKK